MQTGRHSESFWHRTHHQGNSHSYLPHLTRRSLLAQFAYTVKRLIGRLPGHWEDAIAIFARTLIVRFCGQRVGSVPCLGPVHTRGDMPTRVTFTLYMRPDSPCTECAVSEPVKSQIPEMNKSAEGPRNHYQPIEANGTAQHRGLYVWRRRQLSQHPPIKQGTIHSVVGY